MFQEGLISRVVQNGNLSKFLNLERRCRQGDPFSRNLFIICGKSWDLNLAIKASMKIKGILIYDNERRSEQFVDDMSLCKF